ncbi:MAG: penicillin-binding protein 1A [Desulfobacteraceae bacterium]|nr:penicillin-binding protein 1A [Desulfobacteraceae bacterium]
MFQRKKKTSEILYKRARKKPEKTRGKFLKWVIGLFFLVVVCGVFTAFGIYYYLCEDLPQISSLKDYQPSLITSIYSDDHRKIGEFYRERRIVLSLDKIPETMKQAFIAAEDSRFYKHQGIDFLGILRAFIKNVEAGSIVQGGSTITQQVTKSFLLTPERSYTRKIKEAILAYRIDKSFTKDEVLFLYLNQIYLGHGAYGVGAAAENYFGKSADLLTLAEQAILAGLPQAPSKYSPFKHWEKAKQRQVYVLNRMVAEGYITNMEATEAINEPMDIKPRRNWYIEHVPCFTEYVRQYVEKKYGTDALYSGGLQVYTTVNIEMQKAATEEIQTGLKDLDKRQGYRGPLKHVSAEERAGFLLKLDESIKETPLEAGVTVKALVTDIQDAGEKALVQMGKEQGVLKLRDMTWARPFNTEIAHYNQTVRSISKVLKAGDVVLVELVSRDEETKAWQVKLEQEPKAESALVCIETDTGHVKTMAGGRDFRSSQFNRAIQSRRQPGSAFKPLIYAAAIDRGYTAASMIIDAPIAFEDKGNDSVWKPKNYKEKFYGPTLFREALTESRNVVTVKILQDIGVGYAIQYARKMGIESPISRDLSIALGSSGVSLFELTKAYSVFANMGYLIEPVFITKITDIHGTVLEEAAMEREKVIEESTAYIMTNLMEGVVKFGTGQRVRALNRPAAGKTGTTNNLVDAWFMGYTPRYVTGTWVGFDDEKSLGVEETGSRAASPIWLEFMKRVLEDKPIQVFQVPEGVVFSRIDAETGFLPTPDSRKTIFECFKEGTVPRAFTPKENAISEGNEFFKDGL